MDNWKKIVLRTAAFGGGFAVVAAAIFAGFLWWSSRPAKPIAWNTQAVKGTYDGFTVEDDSSYYTFWYVLQNTSDVDYDVTDGTLFSVSGRTDEGNLAECPDCIEIKKPFFVPAHDSLRLQVIFKYKYPKSLTAVTDAEKSALHDSERQYLIEEYGGLNGFSILDRSAHYKIELPGDWKKFAKQKGH